jgi:hypothetical protein
MTAPVLSRYRGYEIVPQRQWSSWCVGIYPTRADLPILPRSTLSTLRTHLLYGISSEFLAQSLEGR